jgi:hypothetical protein
MIFNEIESILACWYYMADRNGRTNEETDLIKKELMAAYDIWEVVNWDGFIAKWNELRQSDDFDTELIKNCKQSLFTADESSKIVALVGMWEIAVKSIEENDKSWSSAESEFYLDFETYLGINRNVVKEELQNGEKVILTAVIEKYKNLYSDKKYSEFVDFYEKRVLLSKKVIDIDLHINYMWALFQIKAKEQKAFEFGRNLYFENPTSRRLNSLMGAICRWIGETTKNLDTLEDAIKYFKNVDNKEEILRCKELIKLVKENIKAEEKNLKQREKEQETQRKEEEKRKEKEAELSKHKLKSSRGEIYCMFCGMFKSRTHVFDYCSGRINDHNYVFMKDKNDQWELLCNKCGYSRSYASESCS